VSDADPRDPAERAEDHAGIGRLADGLVPALIARLASSQLGELEVQEGDWRVRLRRPAVPDAQPAKTASDRASRTSAGHDAHGHPRSASEGKRGSRNPIETASTNGAGGGKSGTGLDAATRAVATSPAVGVFQPGSRSKAGTSVRAGDRLGVVDLLGVPQDVLAPADGVVRATLVEAGTAVEYGQELVRVELAVRPEGS
jgi:biotin carboxyl carrier protein